MKAVTTFLSGARAAMFVAALVALMARAGAAPLVSLEYKITGVQLTVTPAALSVPKGIAGSVLMQVSTGGDDASMFALTNGAYIDAVLRGPNIDARRVVGAANAPLLLPPLGVSGDYQLANIRLIDATTGAVRLEADPATVPVHIFEEALVSKVTSRPLTSEEIKDKGIAIDENNFRAVEFEVGFVLDGKSVPVKFPVVAPTFSQSTEIIPAAELEAKLAQAADINRQIASEAKLPPELEQSNLHIDVQGVNFQRVDVNDQDLALKIPPIPALMVIPGNIGYLHQFFSVQIFTENGAPAGSGLSVVNVKAELVLPPGPDNIAATGYENPGDDPVRFARLGPDKIVQPIQTIVRPGPDGKIGTPDDIGRLYPGESGQAEFLVEGLQEGLHVMDLSLTADLEGLAAGIVKVKGKTAGSVLVRNPKFSLAFTHPRTVRSGEPYEASATILNTSSSLANQVRISLGSASLSGGVLESDETVELGDIPPGQSRTATWRVRAQRTGAISFSNLTTGDDSVIGRFRLKMGIDERGVALSPDTIGMPDYVSSLPTNLVKAATRVLGQALSVSTAPQLPAGVLPIAKGAITTRVLELAEAGQRIRYGDSPARVLADLLLDWQGHRSFNAGIDQILRETDAGAEWRDAIQAELENADALNATARLANAAPDYAGRSETFIVFATSDGDIEANIGGGSVVRTNSARAQSLIYSGTRGSWLVSSNEPAGTITLRFTNATSQATASALFVQANGTAQRYDWTISNPSATGCYKFDFSAPTQLRFDADCDGLVDDTLTATATTVNERAPEVISVLQDLTVQAGRPLAPCGGGFGKNYGTVLAVMFSKPMAQDQVNVASAYALDNGNVATSVQIQPGARVALLNMKAPVSAIRPRTMTVSGISDARGNAVMVASKLVQSDVRTGTAIRGRVVRADGSFAANIPVTLTMYDMEGIGFDCVPLTVRVSQVNSDTNGFFEFDFLMAGVPYSVSATDTSALSDAAKQLVLDSVSGDAVNRDKLQELANSPSAQGTLLAAFAVGAMPEAIAKAEGLDRALLRDLIPSGSAREGTETIVALRFRGRGSVTGQVLGSDGATPVAKVAVNLFPDPDSRELGRGVFSDDNGKFAFYGVPLGAFSVQAQANSGQFRTVADTIDTPGTIKSINIVLSTNAVTLTSVSGRVLESDGISGHAGAQALIGKYADGKFGNIVAFATADQNGFWTAANFPAGIHDIVAISIDGKRKGERRDVSTAGGNSFITITLDGRATVFGRVETSTGMPVANALVAGGETLVRTDQNGLFTMPGVPVGPHSLTAGLERNPAAGVDFPRLGSGSLDVIPGDGNFVVIRLNPAGRIIGRVLDALGQPVPNIRVAIPQDDGFMWVETDGSGNYRFENLGLGGYNLSAPAGPAVNNDTTGLIDKIRNGSEDEVQAAINDAFAIFTGAADPYLNGEGEKFNPRTWGYTRATLQFDGQTVVADIHFLREGTVSGTVLNAQGVPIGARVRLTGVGPLPNGMPTMIIRGEMNSDPALGTFAFPGQLLAGDWGLQVASPFYPIVLTDGGRTSDDAPDATNRVLRFPPVSDVNGRLVGHVFMPDGSLTSSNINVKISFGSDYVIRTDSNGFFDTQLKLPAVAYAVEAEDPVSGFRGNAGVNVIAGLTNVCDVHLLGKGSLLVLVRQADGSPAIGASVEIAQGGFPGDRFTGAATDGSVTFENIFESGYSVGASIVSGPTTIYGRSSVTVTRNQTATAIVTLTPTANVRGQFVMRDLVTPVGFAQVAIGNLGFAATDADGRFEIKGVPLGTYRLVTQDPVSGIGATALINLTANGQILDVRLVEQARGEVRGAVINSYGTGFVPGATVTLDVSDGLTPARTVTTGPDGQFSFPGTPAGPFSLQAEDPVTHLGGHASATLAENAASFEANIALESLGILHVTVVAPDGSTRQTNAAVTLDGPRQLQADVDANGEVTFIDLPLGKYEVTARSLTPSESHSFGVATASLGTAGETNDVTVRLAGVGKVVGRVVASDGVTPVIAATVSLTTQASLFQGQTVTAISDASGNYAFENVSVGDYRVSATDEALGASEDSSISVNGETDTIHLILGPSGSISGRLVRADGVRVVGGIDVLITFTSQSGLPGRAFVRSAADGTFAFDNVPVGNTFIQADVPDFAGLIRTSAFLAVNGQHLALGDLAFDEDDPRVIAVVPANTAVDVPTTTKIDLYFNERLITTTVNPAGVFLRSGTNRIDANVNVLPDPTNGVLRLVRISPLAPLASQHTFEVVVIDGERKDPTGGVIATGPTDLVGRPLVTPFVSRFSTADNAPPQLVSIFPTNNSIQIDPAAIMRLTFNEPISTGAVVTVTGPAGAISGSVNLALNGLSLVFTPNQLLAANTTYTLSASNIKDLAGNAALNQPFVASFSTVDTTGPQIATLAILGGRSPVASSTIQVEATLTVPEPGASVRFSQDFTPIGAAIASPYRFNVTLPANGSTTIRAIGIDRFNNEGEAKDLVINTVSNQPPVISFARGNPPTGGLGNGQLFTLVLSATDDVAVTNMNVRATGLITLNTNFSSGAQRTLAFTIPADAVPGSSVEFRARAIDSFGVASTESVIAAQTIDTAPPTLAIVSPAADSLLDPNAGLNLAVASSDNGTNAYHLFVTVDSLSITQSIDIAAAPNFRGTNVFTIPLADASKSPVPLIVAVRATDGSGNVASASRSFRLPDREPPRIVSVSPSAGANNQSLWTDRITFQFSEPLDTNFVGTNIVVLTNQISGALTYDVAAGADSASVFVRPQLPLAPATTYTNILFAGLKDLAGNALVTAAGSAWSADGVAFTFKTAGIAQILPTNGATVDASQSFNASVSFDSGLGADFIRFVLNTNPPVDINVSPGATSATASLLAPANATAGHIAISAHKNGFDPYVIGGIDVVIEPSSGPVTNENRPPTIDGGGTQTFEVVQNVATNLPFTIRDADHNLKFAEIFGANVATFFNLGFGPGSLSQIDFMRPADVSQNFSDINYPSTGAPLWPGGPTSDFAMRFQGTFTATNEGSYSFWISSDDGSALYVDGQLAVNNDGLHGMSEAGATITLSAGPHTLDARMFENGGSHGVIVSWAGPDFPKQLMTFDGTLAYWADSKFLQYFAGDQIGLIHLPMTVQIATPGTNTLQVVVSDFDSNTVTQRVDIVTLADLDHDGIADRDDPDIDGDGIPNDVEVAQGTDPRNPDTDGDGIPDNLDTRPLSPNVAPSTTIAGARTVLSFDGANDFSEKTSPTSDLNPNNSSWTISAWIRSGDTNPVSMYIASRYEAGWAGGSDGDPYSYWALFLDQGHPAFELRGNGMTGDPIVIAGTNDLRDGGWHLVAGVLDRSTQQISVYVDGQRQGLASAAGLTQITDAGSPFSVGRLFREGFAPPTGYFHGWIDQVRIWSVARTQSDLQAELVAPPASTTAGLVADWSFHEGSGTIASNLVADTNHLTLGNTDATTRPQWVRSFDQIGTSDRLFTLSGLDPEGDPITAVITALPAGGRLYQTSDGISRGAQITSVSVIISNAQHKVVFAPPPGVNAPQYFSYKITDGWASSPDAMLALWSVPLPTTDTDGDGMPDVYEVQNGLNPELDDSALDLDSDGLSNLAEYQRGTNPRDPDTDHDGLLDGEEIAAGSDPFKVDTDGDGLWDGFDSHPTTINSGLTFTGPTTVSLQEGDSTNILVQVTSTNAPIVLLDYLSDLDAPTFSVIGGIQFTNTGSNYMASATLALNPLHDASGQSDLKLRAAARDGASGTFTIHISVSDNVGLSVTKWKDPVNGSWSDGSKWTAGVPTSDVIAVIDVPGSYQVNIDSGVAAKGFVLNSANVSVGMYVDNAWSFPAEFRAGIFGLANDRTLSINQTLMNRGAIYLPTQNTHSYLRGSGILQNSGRLISYVGGPQYGAASHIGVAMTVTASGDMTVNGSAIAELTSPGPVVVSGKTIVQPGGRLYLANVNPAIALTYMEGGRTEGTGNLELYGSNQLRALGELIETHFLQIYESAGVEGSGQLTFYGNQTLRGVFNLAVNIARGIATMDGATFNSDFRIAPNAGVTINFDRTLSINAKGVNAGTLYLANQNTHTYLNGAGWLENTGLIEAYPAGPLYGGETHIYLPISNSSQGKIQLDANAFMRFHDGGGLTNFGTLEVRSGARLAFQDESPSRDFVLKEGSTNIGPGAFQMFRSNRLVLDGPVTFAIHLELYESSKVAGPGPLTLTGPQWLTRIYAAPVVFAPDSQITIDTATFSNSLTVQSNAIVTVNNDRELRIDNVLSNYGTIHLPTQNTHTYLVGAGHVENFGLLHAYQGGPLYGGETHFYVPIHVAPGGLLQLDQNAFLRLHDGSSLSIAGTLEMRSGSRLAVDGNGSARDITIEDGGSIIGAGQFQISGASRLVVNSPITMTPHLELYDSATITGAAILTLNGPQTLSRIYNVPLRIAAGATINIENAVFNAPCTIEQDASVTINNDRTLTVNAPLSNYGTLYMPSQNTHSYLNGSSHVDDFGTIRVFVGSLYGGEAHFYLPVYVAESGTFQNDANAFVNFHNGGELFVSGKLNTDAGSRVLFSNDGPSRRLTFRAGATNTGSGALQFNGSNRLVAETDVTLQSPTYLFESASSEGPGTISLAANQTVYGLWKTPLTIVSNVVLNIENATFASNVVIQPTASLTINNDRYLSVAGTVANRGTINLPSESSQGYLYGGGRIVNEGVFSIYVPGPLYGGIAHLYANIETPTGGRFVATANSMVIFHAGSSLSAAGTVEVQSGASVTFANEFPWRDFTLLDGSELTGAGLTRITGNNRLVVDGNALFSGGIIEMNDFSQIGGDGNLTIGPAATLRIDHSANIAPNINVGGTFVQTQPKALRFDGDLHLQQTGQVSVPGTTSAATFENDGGTLNGVVLVDSSAPTTHWISAAGGNWNSAANWSDGVPDATKIAIIDLAGTYAITVDSPASAYSIRLGAASGAQTLDVNQDLFVLSHFTSETNTTVELLGGSIYGNALWQLRGAFNWSGGSFGAPFALVAQSTASINITGSADRWLPYAFDNFGSVKWSDGRLFANQEVINNRPGGRWEATSDRTFFDGIFNNEGTFVKTGGTGETAFANNAASNLRFNNSGTVSIQAGTLRFDNAGIHSGSFEIAAGAQLTINGGAHQFSVDSTISGAGAFTIAAGSAIILGEYSVTGASTFSSGTIDFSNGGASLPNLMIGNATIVGSADLTIPTDATWTSGAIGGSGTLILAAGKTLTLAGNGDRGLARVFENHGMVAWQDGRIVANGGTVNNRVGAVWQVTGNNPFTDGVFNNEGSFIKSASPNTDPTAFANANSNNLRFNNTGLVDVQIGSLRIDNSGAHTGLFQVASGANLNLNGGTHTFNAASTITGQGTFTANGSLTISGTYTIAGGTTLNGGSLEFANTAVSLPNYTQNNGTLAGIAAISLTSDATWSGGAIAGAGPLTIPTGVTLRILGSSHSLSRLVENFGTILWSEGSIAGAGSTVNNHPGARWQIAGDNPFYDGVINNQGAFIKTAGAADNSSYFGNPAFRFNNTGSVDVRSGVLRLDNAGSHDGVFQVETNALLLLTAGAQSFTTNSHLIGEGKLEVDGAGVTILGEYGVNGGTTLRDGSIDFSNGTNRLANLSLIDGTLTGSADVIVTNSANWQSSAALTGSGRFIVETNVDFTISGGSDRALARTFINHGTVHWNNSRIFANGGVVQNEAGAVWSLDGDNSFFDGVFNNAGTLVKTASPNNDATYFANSASGNLRLNNSGLLRTDVGIIRIDNSGAHTGSFEIKTNTLLILNGGTHDFAGASSIAGEGEFRVTAGQANLGGSYTVTGWTTLIRGALNATAPVTFTKFDMDGGTLTGDGDITLATDSTWTGGTITGAGHLAVAAGATLRLYGQEDRSLSRTVENLGTIRWESGRIFANNGVVNNHSGAIWNLACDSAFFDGVVNNDGIIQKTAGTDSTSFDNSASSNLRFNNNGVVNVQSGAIRIRNTGAHAGLFQAASGTSLIFEGGSHTFNDGSAMAGPGDIHIRVPITLGTDVSFSNATVYFENSVAIAGSFNISNDSGGAFLFANSMTIPGSVTVGGTIATGSASVAVLIGGDLLLLANSTVDNPGLIQAAHVIDQGATILHNAPTETPTSPASPGLRIDSISINDGSSASKKTPSLASLSVASITLSFRATATARIIVETSTDLIHWTQTPCQLAPIAAGKFEARVSIDGGPVRWFRLSQIP